MGPPALALSPSLCCHHAEPGDGQLPAEALEAKAVSGPWLQELSLKAFSEGQPPSTFQVTYHFPFSHSNWQGPSHSSRGQESDSAHQPPPQTLTLTALLWKKGGFHFFPPSPLHRPASNTLTCLSLDSFSHGPPWSGPGSVGSPPPSSPDGESCHQGGLCGPTMRGGKEAGLWRPQLASYYIGFY